MRTVYICHGELTCSFYHFSFSNADMFSDFVSEIMHTHDNEGFEMRQPKSKEIKRAPKYPLGIHQRWSADGHDKLSKIGFPIYAIVDEATSKCLGAWVVPKNRMGDVVAYLFLETVEKYGGKSSSSE